MMGGTERWMRIVVLEAAGEYAWHMLLSLQLLRGYDVALSAMLSVSLVEPLHSLVASVCTKSWRKRTFAEADVTAFQPILDLFDPSLQIWRSLQSRREVVKLEEKVME
ncbi:uncharacterized protein MONOS_14079 [Monocercomonoides exilis]|uniref:uncharacterized protein n=1 Tax=Monocercomonoides exilis TaxID=2049356 RepID=UPI00355958C2|nr:hypothetical protein MONOS_14079 [Monocercomonoides exilis]|eukprot:MONOS_14079.1-p1 / transcript=MONOS_14079.1 / gene=MONOS_14079 / organism=Monocercomonoides_exilis_PA203 / gene_product=unspecified product / transcript_product=unspecified product / location=Mono_scaffold00933:3747-4070(-) / protein_length=108 / sequence_SO=supercontig / SO=protein_coding / is_pseudo=false